MNNPGLSIYLLVFAVLFVSPVQADPFSGNYIGEIDGEPYQLTLSRDGAGQYRGEIRGEGASSYLQAKLSGDRLEGVIDSAEQRFEFVALIQQDGRLYFQDSDGELMVFERVGGGPAAAPKNTQDGQRQVYINRVRLDAEVLKSLETQSQIPIADGRYWYDASSGAWGIEGGPTAGLIYPGLPLPSPLPADISAGGTGIFINGREIHPLDQQALMQLFGVTYLGNFWMDAQGNIGYVGGPAIANILQASQAARTNNNDGGSVTHGYDSSHGARGTAGGGMYSGRTASGKSVFWYPGM